MDRSAPAFGTVAEVATYLNVSEKAVRRLLANGLRHVKLDDSHQGGVRIRWGDLDAYLAERTVER